MGAKKTAWHPPFTGLLQERCPRWAKITGEVQLTAEPLRVDDVIEVWVDRPHEPSDTGATLRGMWRFIVVVGLLEYKSVSLKMTTSCAALRVVPNAHWKPVVG